MAHSSQGPPQKEPIFHGSLCPPSPDSSSDPPLRASGPPAQRILSLEGPPPAAYKGELAEWSGELQVWLSDVLNA